MRVHPDGMGHVARGPGPARQEISFDVENAHECSPLRYVDGLVAINEDVRREGDIGPLSDELTIGGKNLDSVVLPVGDEHSPVGMHPDTVREVELTRSRLSRRPPGEQQLALAGEFVHPGVAIAVGDEYLTGGTECDVRRRVEGTRGPVYYIPKVARPSGVGRVVPLPQRQEELTISPILQYHVRVLDR